MPILSRDTALLFISRILRLFAFGSLSVILALYLGELKLTETQIGVLLTLTLLGDAAISLWLTTSADQWGRRRVLIVGACLMTGGGLIFGLTDLYWVLIVAAIIGVISPSGNEIGPFLAVEQAALSQLNADSDRTKIFAWYNLMGSLSTALGALFGGLLVQNLQAYGLKPIESFQAILIIYAIIGMTLAWIASNLSALVEAPTPHAAGAPTKRRLGLHKSFPVVMKLSALFALDAFAGGFIVQSFIAYWFYVQFDVDPAILGAIFFGANILSGFSSLTAAWLAGRFGLINTMVWTHIPANFLLISLPFMPTLPFAITTLMIRSTLSQMDVPTRQSYTMAVVDPDERSAASGVTNIARSIGSSLAPSLTGALFSAGLMGLPLIMAGGLKIIYDLSLYFNFRSLKPPEEIRHQQA